MVPCMVGHRTESVLRVLEGLLGEVTFAWRPADGQEMGVESTVAGLGNGVNSHHEGLEVESPECVTAFAEASFIFGLHSLGYHLEAMRSCF